ncbi:uncharacterized protein LOC134681908 [Mytilus trossulus]|uniref:uncharacterized protein LOC134681908 n=1 Tax=Mytilus trossulus TaxID=6551 RepID=UPI003003C199
MHLNISLKLICIIHLLFLLLIILKVSSEQCKTEIFTINPDKRDVKLHGFTYCSFDQTTPRGCLSKCIQRPLCHSYNYNMAHLTCELNMTPETLSEVYFQHDKGYIYIEIQHYRGNTSFNPCIGNPCSKNEICVRLKNKEIICIKDDVILPNKNPENVALGKLARQYTTLDSYSAYKAVDGLTTTFSHTDKILSPFWSVDLGTIYNIIRIEIINRDSSGKRLRDLDITVGPRDDDMSMCAHFTGPGTNGEHLVFQCKGWYIESRYVKMTIIKGPEEYLQLAEVKVFGYPTLG